MECRVKDIPIYYEEAGLGRPLLMLHGGGLDHRHMQDDMEPLFTSRTGWRRIYPDLPGMGKTRAADWITDQDDMLDVVLEFIDAVAPGERFAVAGMSYGGYLARGVVNRRRAHIDGLLLIVPVIEPDRRKRILPEHRVLRDDEEFLAALAPDEQVLRELAVVQSLGLLMQQRNSIIPAIAEADQEFLERLEANYAFTFDVDALAEPFTAPALFLTGRFDHWCGYQDAYQILESYPRATFAILDRAGHALTHEQSSLFEALVSEWLDRVEEYAGTADWEPTVGWPARS
jgi:pimeloyl-ACP methyl ester carboxylesterase